MNTNHSTSVVGCCDRSKPFLARCVPEANHHYMLFYALTKSDLLLTIIIIINKVLIKVTLNKVIARALYIVICG